jgi:DNA-binding NarL/FixJ family response regulator
VSGLGNRIGAVALARAMHARHPRLRVSLLVEDAAASVVDFRNEPIDGVLRASLSLKRVALDLQRIVAGERVLPARWLYPDPPESNPLAGLSTRQREILELIAGGQSSKEIAEVLHVSLNTVKYHVRKVYERLHVSTRLQAARVLQEASEEHGAVGR